MPDRRPTLVVDIGNTLVRRSRPGLLTRVLAVLRTSGTPVDDSARRLVALTVFTAPDRDTCTRALAARYPVAAAGLRDEVHSDDGHAVILDGARDLLATATDSGWRIVAATNAAVGTPALPPELAGLISVTATSWEYGKVKEDPSFWAALVQREGIDPLLTLVVGDSEPADRDAPMAAGLQARLVTRPGAVLALASQIGAAGPCPPEARALVAGDAEPWAGRAVVSAPHLTSLVTRVTRARHVFTSGEQRCQGTVVRRRALPPAVVADHQELPAVSWLLERRGRGTYVVPADLRRELQHQGLSLDGLGPEEYRHAIAMIREARSEQTTAERISDLVRYLKERTAASEGAP
nr:MULTISPECIES: HAD family hydrolase [Streptomyces]